MSSKKSEGLVQRQSKTSIAALEINNNEVQIASNAKVVKSWSSSNRIVKGVDDLATKIKSDCGMNCDRSKILNMLAELIIEKQAKIDVMKIRDQKTLRDELGKALKK